jgi:predicted ferric reductase
VTGVLAALDPKTTWYVARASGVLTWLLCVAALAWGLFLSSALVKKRGLPAWLLDLHSFLGTLTVIFCTVHLGALALDDYVEFGWAELFVPMASPWRPGAVAWGIVAMYLLVAVEVTSLLRKRIPRRVWRAVHMSSFGIVAFGTVHGIQAGSDWGTAAMQAGLVATGTVVFGVIAVRLTKPNKARVDRPAVPEPG